MHAVIPSKRISSNEKQGMELAKLRKCKISGLKRLCIFVLSIQSLMYDLGLKVERH